MRAMVLALALALVASSTTSGAAEPLRRRWPLIAELADATFTPPLTRKDLDEPCDGDSYPNPYSPLPKPLRQRHHRVTLPMRKARVELRDAFLVDLPRAISFELTAPHDARLELAYRLFKCGERKPATLRITTEDALGKDVQTIPLTLARDRDVAWRELAVDLRVAPGLPFRLTIEGATEASRGDLMLALAEPAITGREGLHESHADTNILWIVIDAVRADALGPGRDFTVATGSPTPTLDAIFARGAAFARAYALGNQTRTSTTAMIASVPPSIGGFHSHDWAFAKGRLDTFYKSSPPLVTSVLEDAGWRVAHFGHNFFLWGSEPVGIDAGFPRIVDFRSIPADAVDASDSAVAFFERHQDERWMLMLNYTAPHTPYQAPEEWDEAAQALPGPERFGRHEHLPRSYLGELMWVDHNLTRVMAALDRLHLTERTLVIVTADHGEVMLPWHDCRGTGGERCGFNHSWTLYEDEVHVPLALALPARLPAKVIEPPVSHLDLAPTILDVVGLPPAPGMAGASLLPLALHAARGSVETTRPRPIYADGRRAAMLRSGDWKLIVHSPDDAIEPRARFVAGDKLPKHELFDLAADPDEKKNLAVARPDDLKRLLAELAQVRADLYARATRRGEATDTAHGTDGSDRAHGPSPDPSSQADNRLMLVGGKDVRALTGTVRAVGGRAACTRVPSGGECVALPDGSLSIRLDAPAGGQAQLAFTTTPWSAPLDLALDAGWLPGRLPVHRLRLGAWGLALLRPGEALDRPERLALAARADPNAAPLPQPHETAVYFWRSAEPTSGGHELPATQPSRSSSNFVAPEDAVGDPDADAQLGDEMRKVLKDLGYSN